MPPTPPPLPGMRNHDMELLVQKTPQTSRPLDITPITDSVLYLKFEKNKEAQGTLNTNIWKQMEFLNLQA